MRVYIGGPITGRRNYNKEAFAAAEKKLTACGKAVWNPTKLHPANPTIFSHEDYLEVCFAMIRRSDMVVLLDGWEDSKGARMEASYAEKHNIPVLEMKSLKNL